MMRAPAVRVGDTVDAIETPALVIDHDAMLRNMLRMADFAEASGMRLRPHAKMHKSAVIAGMQVQAGAVGVCVQKTSEAEALAAGGVEDIFISNEVIDPAKLERVAQLARRIRLAIAVDSALGIDRLAAALKRASAMADVSSRSTPARAAAAWRRPQRARSRSRWCRTACALRASRPTTARPSTCGPPPTARPRCAMR